MDKAEVVQAPGGGAKAPVQGGLRRLRIAQLIGGVTMVLIAALESWTHRFIIYSDGLSYLDIADAYAGGYWRDALNAYWSPLYSWLLAAGKLLAGSSPQRELAILQIVNFLCFLAALAAFEFLIRELLRANRDAEKPAFMVAAYLVFGWASLALVKTYRPQPDMLVMAFWLVASVFILRINRGGRLTDHLILGAVLGLAYLAKTAMLVIALITFAATVRSRRGMAGMAVFGLIAAPWIAAISLQKGRLTIGDSGRLNYAWEVNGVSGLFTGGLLTRRTRRERFETRRSCWNSPNRCERSTRRGEIHRTGTKDWACRLALLISSAPSPATGEQWFYVLLSCPALVA